MTSGIKAIPISSENEAKYGISFCGNKDIVVASDTSPMSSIYIGANGSGKTSLYVSLEILGMGKSLIAKGHNYNDVEQVNVNTNVDASSMANLYPKITAIAMDGIHHIEYKPGTEIGLRIPASFYVSEYDVFNLERKDFDTEYLCEQLGLESFYKMYKFLIAFANLNNEAIETIRANIPIKGTVNEETENETEQLEQRKKIFEQRNGISADLFITSKFEFEQLDQCVKLFRSHLNSSIEKFHELANKYIPTLLKQHANRTEDFQINLIRHDNLTEIHNIEIKLRIGNSQARSPRNLYNTFRFKLFVVCLKVSMAICAQRIHHILFPIIIDDIFDASDFANRSNIHFTVADLLTSYKQHFYQKDNYPLQFIVFSQDELITDGFYKALRRETGIQAVKYSRLHNVQYCMRNKCKEIKISSPNHNPISFRLLESIILNA